MRLSSLRVLVNVAGALFLLVFFILAGLASLLPPRDGGS